MNTLMLYKVDLVFSAGRQAGPTYVDYLQRELGTWEGGAVP